MSIANKEAGKSKLPESLLRDKTVSPSPIRGRTQDTRRSVKLRGKTPATAAQTG